MCCSRVIFLTLFIKVVSLKVFSFGLACCVFWCLRKINFKVTILGGVIEGKGSA